MAVARRADAHRPQSPRPRRGEGQVHHREDARVAGWPPRFLTARSGPNRADGEAGAIAFIEAACRIVKDSLGGPVGQRLVLREWQRELLRGLLAERDDGRLAARTAYVGLPRKNGKSALLSSLALWALIFGPDGGEVYSVAGEKEQARITFGTGRRMVELEPELGGVLRIYRDAIEMPSTGSVWRVVSSEAPLKEGLSPTFTLVDEVHVIDRDLWDVFALAQGARPEPLMVGITTAGVRTDSMGRDSFAYGLHDYGRRVASGEVVDPTFYFAWWGALDDADFRDPDVWRGANPGYGDLVGADDFAAAVLRTPEPEYRTKRLNQWVNTFAAWLPTGSFERLAAERTIATDEPIVLAFDGSWSNDSTGIVGCTLDGHLEVLGHWERPPTDEAWRVDIDEVEGRIRELCRTYHVLEVACDPYRWSRTMQALEAEGIPIVEFTMSSAVRMVKATQTFYDAVVNERLTHTGDPRLIRHVGNAVLKLDRFGARVSKDAKTSNRKIDLAVCAVAAFTRAVDIAMAPPEMAPDLFFV